MMPPGIEMGNCGSSVRDPGHLQSPLRRPGQAGHISPQLQQWTGPMAGVKQILPAVSLENFSGVPFTENPIMRRSAPETFHRKGHFVQRPGWIF